MKIQIYANEFFDVFPDYKEMLLSDYNKYTEMLEVNNYNIEKIKDKQAKNIFGIQLSTKEDFNIEVIEQNGSMHIKNIDKDTLIALLLRNEHIVFNFDTSKLENIDVKDYLNHKYNIYVKQYKDTNYIGEGNINWNDINNEVKNNWEKSFFFLDQMHNEQFVENNKQLILEKIKDDTDMLKETLTKSVKFFNYASNKLPVDYLLELLNGKEGYLCDIWNNKIKDIQKKCNYSKMIEKEKNDIGEELKDCWEYLMKNSFNSYGEVDDGQYTRLRDRLNKQLKSREKEIKAQAEKNQTIIDQVDKLLENDELRKSVIKGLLKNDIYKDDFERFEKEIIQDEELTNMVIKKGLYKTLAVTQNFVNSLSEDKFEIFVRTCSQNLERSVFIGDDKKYFQKIVKEDKLLPLLQKVIENGQANNNKEWKILMEYKPKSKALEKALFYLFPKERFVELAEDLVTEEEVTHYLNSGGYVYNAKEKINIYTLTNIETIKLMCSQDSEVLKSKKAPQEWKNNVEIIKEFIKSNGDLEYVGIKKENILELSKNIDATIEIVREDKKLFFYKNLPEKIKNNKQVALALLEEKKDIKEVISILPKFILKDKRFNIDLIKKEPKATMYLNEDIWNDKEFVLTLLYEVENTPQEKEIGKNLPNKIKLFFETFNIQENFYTFFNNYQLQKKLEEKFVTKETVKEKRMKI